MGGKSSAPAPPDYGPIAAASEKAAEYSYAASKDQLAWAKEQYGQDRQIADRVVNSALNRQAINDSNALKDRARYEKIYQPLENDLAQDAKTYSTPARQQYDMGRAEAQVAQTFQSQREAAARQLEGYGVDPSSTRFAALDTASRIQQAASEAGAANQARTQDEAIGRSLRSEAINVGRGYPGQIAQTYSTALQSGNQGINSQLAATASGANTMGTGLGWEGAGTSALNTWGNTLNMSYQNQLGQFMANQQASSGIGSLLGAGLGLLGNSSFGGASGLGLLALADGGSVSTDGPTEGGTVPVHASPTGGKAIDDVPARLTVGEFVVPKDVVSWKGEEYFQKMIDGSRKAKQSATAKPKFALAPDEQATFTSRPTGALPVG